MKIAFEALIKKYTPICLASGDQQVALELQLNDDAINKEVLEAISNLYLKTPERIMVVMMDKEEAKK